MALTTERCKQMAQAALELQLWKGPIVGLAAKRNWRCSDIGEPSKDHGGRKRRTALEARTTVVEAGCRSSLCHAEVETSARRGPSLVVISGSVSYGRSSLYGIFLTTLGPFQEHETPRLKTTTTPSRIIPEARDASFLSRILCNVYHLDNHDTIYRHSAVWIYMSMISHCKQQDLAESLDSLLATLQLALRVRDILHPTSSRS
ncbi:hypothetical protein CONLIGDRAFT_696713 [Coniochaeta ligniaria NRRL 30616]|uniref:Uncharacterized protein n=1 Tax=Coniochaeta ligniaria NRRL 30616 TaxID=1408157 RepID=A0A1J7J1Q2_9PEZI|nr:hypothetical protein CONLIGDRAFT_696713 [Coniochaeta ligniaria NRRL 30616]